MTLQLTDTIEGQQQYQFAACRNRAPPADSTRVVTRLEPDSYLPADGRHSRMATTQVALALIGITLLSLALLTWATVHYVPAILSADGHGDRETGGHAG